MKLLSRYLQELGLYSQDVGVMLMNHGELREYLTEGGKGRAYKIPDKNFERFDRKLRETSTFKRILATREKKKARKGGRVYVESSGNGSTKYIEYEYGRFRIGISTQCLPKDLSVVKITKIIDKYIEEGEWSKICELFLAGAYLEIPVKVYNDVFHVSSLRDFLSEKMRVTDIKKWYLNKRDGNNFSEKLLKGKFRPYLEETYEEVLFSEGILKKRSWVHLKREIEELSKPYVKQITRKKRVSQSKITPDDEPTHEELDMISRVFGIVSDAL